MSIRTNEDVLLRRDDYLKLVKAQEEAQRIIETRAAEVNEARMLARFGNAQAVFFTRDGLEAQGNVPPNWHTNLILELPCRRIEHGPLTAEINFIPLEIRRYEWRGEYRMGLPILHEI